MGTPRINWGSQGIIVSKPGIDVTNYGSLRNTIMSSNARMGQILEHGQLAMTIDQFGNSQGSTPIGPYGQAPDLIYQLIFNDDIMRHPPTYYRAASLMFINYSTTEVTISTNTFSIFVRAPGTFADGSVPTPIKAVSYQIFRRGAAA